MRIQLALNVSNLDAAVDFYSKLFGAPVHKRKPGYANFAIESPPLKLVLFEVPGAAERLNHLGVEVFDDSEVAAATDRIRTEGLPHRVEDQTTCCYAKQTKVWASDPDGAQWEWYRVIEDSESFGSGAVAPAARDAAEKCAPKAEATSSCCA
jgi:catechol 2,3-dioxygenase-like lactoylglutathione lyase family enzyme